jgi:hypothetical protein
MRKGTRLATNPTQPHCSSDHPPHVKRGLIQSLHRRTSTIRQEHQDLCNEISTLRRDLQLNGYPQGFID